MTVPEDLERYLTFCHRDDISSSFAHVIFLDPKTNYVDNSP